MFWINGRVVALIALPCLGQAALLQFVSMFVSWANVFGVDNFSDCKSTYLSKDNYPDYGAHTLTDFDVNFGLFSACQGVVCYQTTFGAEDVSVANTFLNALSYLHPQISDDTTFIAFLAVCGWCHCYSDVHFHLTTCRLHQHTCCVDAGYFAPDVRTDHGQQPYPTHTGSPDSVR